NHVVAERLVEGAATTGKAAGEASVPRALLRCHPDTLPEVKKALLEVLPEELKHSAPMDEPLPALLQWCSARLPPVTYEAVCDKILKGFKEAQYMVPDTEQDLGHWALALPTYMHFTSPIRRYADVLVHRRLAVLLGFDAPQGQSHEDFLNSLKAAVETCNVKKRAAQDAQMEEIQIAISDYVQRSGGVDVDDAVLTKILVHGTTRSPEELPEWVERTPLRKSSP
ncbi:unnamed protein product, partial [Effrenium voratum]